MPEIDYDAVQEYLTSLVPPREPASYPSLLLTPPLALNLAKEISFVSWAQTPTR